MSIDRVIDSFHVGPKQYRATASRWDRVRKCMAESATATGKTRREAERKAAAMLRAALAGKN